MRNIAHVLLLRKYWSLDRLVPNCVCTVWAWYKVILILTVRVITSALADWVAVLYILSTAPSRGVRSTIKNKKLNFNIFFKILPATVRKTKYCAPCMLVCTSLILTSSVRMSIWSRICRPRRSTGLWPDSSQHRPPRTHHSDGEPGGSPPTLTLHTVVAIKKNKQTNRGKDQKIK